MASFFAVRQQVSRLWGVPCANERDGAWDDPLRSDTKVRPTSPTQPAPSLTMSVSCSIDAPGADDSEPHPATILVSLPPTYPTSAPPQLQLLSRYIGPYGVDATLFGSVLRTYISRGAVEWTAGAECVFDGLEWVKEHCAEWLGERMSERRVGELLREDERGRPEDAGGEGEGRRHARAREVREDGPPAEMPPGITITEAEPIQDRKSAFVGRACRITDPSQVSKLYYLEKSVQLTTLRAQVPLILAHLMSDRRIARAAHPIINAWRCRVGSVLHQGKSLLSTLVHLQS